eukprot:1158788-Pelagomonas_calceolata.AAC.3
MTTTWMVRKDHQDSRRHGQQGHWWIKTGVNDERFAVKCIHAYSKVERSTKGGMHNCMARYQGNPYWFATEKQCTDVGTHRWHTHLKQDVEHIHVRLLDLIKKDHAVRLVPDFLCELASLHEVDAQIGRKTQICTAGLCTRGKQAESHTQGPVSNFIITVGHQTKSYRRGCV